MNLPFAVGYGRPLESVVFIDDGHGRAGKYCFAGVENSAGNVGTPALCERWRGERQ